MSDEKCFLFINGQFTKEAGDWRYNWPVRKMVQVVEPGPSLWGEIRREFYLEIDANLMPSEKTAVSTIAISVGENKVKSRPFIEYSGCKFISIHLNHLSGTYVACYRYDLYQEWKV